MAEARRGLFCLKMAVKRMQLILKANITFPVIKVENVRTECIILPSKRTHVSESVGARLIGTLGVQGQWRLLWYSFV